MTISDIMDFLGTHATAIGAAIAVLGAIGVVVRYFLDRTVFAGREKSSRDVGEIYQLLELLKSHRKNESKPQKQDDFDETYEEAIRAARVLAEIKGKLQPLSLREVKVPRGVDIVDLGDDKIGLAIQVPLLGRVIGGTFFVVWCAAVGFIFLGATADANIASVLIVLLIIIAAVLYVIKRGARVVLSPAEYSYSSPGAWTKMKKKPEIELKVRAANGGFQAVMEIDGCHIIGKSDIRDTQQAAIDELSDFYRSLNWWLKRPVEVADGVLIRPT